eukprot:Amastigsp_a676426_198.p5 type:complete len:106 gc:universal Amastigsp_a676426_198:1475-1792(+)
MRREPRKCLEAVATCDVLNALAVAEELVAARLTFATELNLVRDALRAERGKRRVLGILRSCTCGSKTGENPLIARQGGNLVRAEHRRGAAWFKKTRVMGRVVGHH